MKKILALLLAFVLCLSLCACGKTDATKAVEAQIAALTDVTFEDEALVTAARGAYNALTEKEQKKVKNIDTLTQAEETIQTFKKEVQKQAEEIVATHNPYEAIPLLRQLPQTGRVKVLTENLAYDLLKSYVLTEGVPSNLRGEPKEDGKCRTVFVEQDGKQYQFTLEVGDGAELCFEQRDESPYNGMVLDSYKIHLRTHRLYMGISKLYSKTEHFSKDGDWFYVGWNAFIPADCTRERLSHLLVDMDCSESFYWPYDMSEVFLEENIHSDVDEFVEEMDACLQKLDLPITAWEVLGIFE